MFMLGSPCSIIVMSSFLVPSWSFLSSLLLSMNMTFLWNMSIITPESPSVMLILAQRLLLCVSERFSGSNCELWVFQTQYVTTSLCLWKVQLKFFRAEDLSPNTHFHPSHFHQHTSSPYLWCGSSVVSPLCFEFLLYYSEFSSSVCFSIILQTAEVLATRWWILEK